MQKNASSSPPLPSARVKEERRNRRKMIRTPPLSNDLKTGASHFSDMAPLVLHCSAAVLCFNHQESSSRDLYRDITNKWIFQGSKGSLLMRMAPGILSPPE